MAYRITKPADLGGENFPSIFGIVYSEKALKSLTPGMAARRESYGDVFGRIPADEYILLTLILNRAVSPEDMYSGEDPGETDGFFLESEEAYLYDQLSPVDVMHGEQNLAPYFGRYDVLLTLFTGTERIGSDGTGDGFLIDMAGRGDSHPVYRYEHDYGTVEGMLNGSIASFFAELMGLGSEQGDEGDFIEYPLAGDAGEWKRVYAQLEKFDEAAEKEKETGPFYRDPHRLFKRSHWLLQHTTGKPTYDFASYMKHAPDYEAWQNEKALLKDEPVLANYWLLHHFFLGNQGALEESAVIAAQSPARMTRFLADAVMRAAKGESGLLTLDVETTKRLVNETSRNADMKLFEPARREAMGKDRGEDRIKRIPEDELESIREDEDALWAALEKYPEDIQGHDEILKALGELDDELKEVVDDYFDERTSEAYNEWPADWQLEDEDFNLDRRLSPVIAAAFISGLGFNAENEKSFSGLTHALSIFDDDHAMHACERAIETLSPEDDRGEYLFANLKRSRHERAPDLIHKAALRFFEIMEEAIRREDELDAERERDGATLNNMWDTQNYFHIPLRACLERADDRAEEIARRILTQPKYFNAFKMNLGRAMAVLGERGVGDFNHVLIGLINWVGEQPVEKESHFGPVTLMNLTEASIALAKLEPEKAREILPEMFARETPGRFFDLDMKASLLGAMFLLREGESEGDSSAEPTAKTELVAWLERLLGNRDNHERLLAALRAARTAALPKSWPWVKHHLYSDVNMFMGHHALIKDMAFAAAEALGHGDAPRFNDEDEYASAVPRDELPAAMERPHLHHIEHVLKRMHEEKYNGADALPVLRDYLLDVLRFSADDNGRTFDGQWSAFQALAQHASTAHVDEARSILREILDLEHCRPGIQNDAVFLMRLLEGEAPFAAWLMGQSKEHVLEMTADPDARALAHLDLVAARAHLLDAVAAEPALEQTIRIRYQWKGGHFAEEDPALVNLPRILALHGDSAKRILRELSEGIDPLGEYGLSHTRDYLEVAMKTNGRSAFAPEENYPETVTMKCSLRGEGWTNGKKTLELKRKGAVIHIRHISHDLDFRGIHSSQDYESEGEWKAADESAAVRGMDELANMFGLLGYRVQPARKQKAKAKK